MCEVKEEYINIQTGEKLDMDQVNGLKDNAMLKVRPDLWRDWDFEKNNELGFDIWKMTKMGGFKVWWYCSFCDDSYLLQVRCRCFKKDNGHCSIKNLNHLNSLYFVNTALASEWHPTLNGELKAHDVLPKSDKAVQWQCEKHPDHVWKAAVKTRSMGNNCPYCSNQKILIGYNDIWTTNPELASKLLNPEDGYKNVEGTTKRVDFKCTDCGEIIKKRKINDVRRNGFVCNTCGDKKPLPEKIMFNLLTQLGIDFDYNVATEWSKGKRYDFILHNYDVIIETHGGQHYLEGFSFVGGKTLDEEQENDKFKLELAKNNKVGNYVVIDCRYSKFDYIKENIISSMSSVIDLKQVKWELIHKRCINNSLLDSICEDWNSAKSIEYIVNKYKISKIRVYEILKLSDELMKCNFNEDIIYELKTKNMKKSVLKFDRFGNFVKKYNGAVDVLKDVKEGNIHCIRNACKDKTDYYGYYYTYEDEYDARDTFKKKRTRGKVLQLDDNLNIIKEWSSCNEAYYSLKGKSSYSDGAISNCCNFKANTAYGFKWLYKDDYEDIKSGLKKYEIYSNHKFNKEVVQLSLDDKFIRKWESMSEASEKLKIAASAISSVCREIYETSNGFKWMYSHEYEKLIKGERIYRKPKDKNTRAKSIIQLDENMRYIKEWRSMVDASKELNILKGSIWWACKYEKIHGGFKWMYKEDYDQYIEQQNKAV